MKMALVMSAAVFAAASGGALEIAADRDATAEIQARIDAAFLAGGGEVRVPAGTHHVRGLRLRGGVMLHLERGAVLLASRDPAAYDNVFADDAVAGRHSTATFFLYYGDVTTPNPEGLVPGDILIRDCRVRNVARLIRYNHGHERWQRGLPPPTRPPPLATARRGAARCAEFKIRLPQAMLHLPFPIGCGKIDAQNEKEK